MAAGCRMIATIPVCHHFGVHMFWLGILQLIWYTFHQTPE